MTFAVVYETLGGAVLGGAHISSLGISFIVGQNFHTNYRKQFMMKTEKKLDNNKFYHLYNDNV